MTQNLSFLNHISESDRIERAKAWAAGHVVGRRLEQETDIESAYHFDVRTNPYLTAQEQDALWTEVEYGRDIVTAHRLRKVPKSLGGAL